jgi:hypothetical protein
MRTVTVTLTAAQSDTWTLSGAAAARVEEELAEQLQDVGFHGAATVLLDDGSVLYTLEVP